MLCIVPLHSAPLEKIIFSNVTGPFGRDSVSSSLSICPSSYMIGRYIDAESSTLTFDTLTPRLFDAVP